MPSRTDSMISHGMGKAKAIKARLKGLTGVWKTLAEQHGEVAALLQRARDNADKQIELWPTIRRELLSHERAEMREIYPVLRLHDDTRALADHHDVEAAGLEQLIAELDDMATGHESWQGRFGELVDTVIAHANEEERDIFPVAQRAVGDARTKELEQTFLTAKREIAGSI